MDSQFDYDMKSITSSLDAIQQSLTNINKQLASVPTTWTLFMITFATWGIGSGMIILIWNVFE